MIKYMARLNDIKKVEVARETDSFVIYANGRRDAKRSGSYNYFDSLEEAKDCIISARQDEIKKLKERILYCAETLDKAINLKEEDLK